MSREKFRTMLDTLLADCLKPPVDQSAAGRQVTKRLQQFYVDLDKYQRGNPSIDELRSWLRFLSERVVHMEVITTFQIRFLMRLVELIGEALPEKDLNRMIAEAKKLKPEDIFGPVEGEGRTVFKLPKREP